MKSYTLANLTLLIVISLSLFCNACTDPEAPHTCDDEALFLREEATGMMVYLPCYDSWAVKLNETNIDGTHKIGASYDLAESLKVDSTIVKIDACFYEFDMELLLPDPAPWGDLFVIKDFEITTDI